MLLENSCSVCFLLLALVLVGLYLLHFIGKLLRGLAVLSGHWRQPAWREINRKTNITPKCSAIVVYIHWTQWVWWRNKTFWIGKTELLVEEKQCKFSTLHDTLYTEQKMSTRAPSASWTLVSSGTHKLYRPTMNWISAASLHTHTFTKKLPSIPTDLIVTF